MLDFPQLVSECAVEMAPSILERIVSVESSFNPWAIGVVGGRLARQPVNRMEAVATANYLHRAGWNFSLGLGQVNRHNLGKYGLDYNSVFEPCDNLRVTARIFGECLQRARLSLSEEQAQKAAFSCYYSGNFRRGFQPEGRNQQSYVDRIMAVNTTLNTADNTPPPIPVIADSATGSTRSPASKSDSRLSRPGKEKTHSGIKELRGEGG